MCGIAGGYWITNSRLAYRKMNEALYSLKTRGPDCHDVKMFPTAYGLLMLGHTRLSVIDLSEYANQPMYSSDGRLCVVFNGEIYNYLELRGELEGLGVVFRTRSDTEVLLAAWATWGESALHRFIGMFAFVIVDFEKDILYAVRDAFGIKPLYYAFDSDGFRFASELQALRILRTHSSQLNWQRAYDYLVHGEYDSVANTFFDGALCLEPGKMLVLDIGKKSEPELKEWWKPKWNLKPNITFEEAAYQYRELLLKSIKLHLRSDVPLGAALSGGLDSSTIVCAMRHLEPDAEIHTFSFVAADSEVSEESWIDYVNLKVGAINHKVTASQKDLANDLEDLIVTQGEPFGSTSIYAQYRVFKLAKEYGMTVTLDGQGADELLGGYNAYPGQRIRSLVEEKRFVDAYKFFNAWSQWPGRTKWDGITRIVGAYGNGSLYQLLRRINGMRNKPSWIREGPLREAGVKLIYPKLKGIANIPGRRMMECLAGSVSKKGLIALLRHGDRNSMRFSIESRVPFLTTELADFTMGLPEEYLVSLQGESKHLLRAAMRGIVPDLVLDRKDKIGFATPEKKWLLGMSGTVREWLSDDLKLPFLDQNKVIQEFDQICSGRSAFTWQVWRWINFCHWYRITFDSNKAAS